MPKLDNLFKPIVTNTFISLDLCYQGRIYFLNMSDVSVQF